MEKLLADCLETVRRSPLNQQGKPPRGPSFVCPGTGSLRARSPLRPPRARPRSEGRTGCLGLGIWPRAALPVGSASSSRQGLSIFRAEEATISRAERPPGLPVLAAPPTSPAPLGPGATAPGPATPRPCTPGPPRARRGVAGAPRTPTALRVFL